MIAGTQNYKYNMASIRGLGNEYDRGVVKSNKSILDNKSGSGARISAWGIITIIMLIIFVGVTVYYFFYCYPFVFSNERKYNIMNSSATVTPTHSRDFQYESTSSKSSRVDI